MTKKITILLALFLLPLTTLGQKIRPSMETPRGSLSDADSGSYTSIEMGFSIKLPKSVDGGGGLDGIENIWRLKEGYYSAGIIEREVDVEHSPDFEKITIEAADKVLDGFARWYFATKPDIIKIDKKTGVYEGHKGMEFRILLSESVCLVRIFWIKNQGVKVGALLAGKQDNFEPEAIKVFDSLRLMTVDTVTANIQKRIEENTPAPLPQSPAAKRLTSDLADVNLKGKIKDVFTEYEYTTEGRADTARRKDSEEYFNQEGNLVKSLEYGGALKGMPNMITAYGYIDGFRASSRRIIASETGPPPGMAPPLPGDSTRPDNRYTTRFEYKYDPAGRLVETQYLNNRGSIRWRSVYSLTGNTLVVIDYAADGSVNKRSTSTIDEKGNPVETIQFDWPEKGSTGNSVYKYVEFDKQGNWTKRTESFSRVSPAKSELYWTRTVYRTITYY